MTRIILRAMARSLVALALTRARASAVPQPSGPHRRAVPRGWHDGHPRARGRAEAHRDPGTVRSSSTTAPGAGGNIGAELVAKSAPDGYTLLMGTVGTHAINASLYAKMPYDHVKDFVPVILVAGVPNVLVVNPSACP